MIDRHDHPVLMRGWCSIPFGLLAWLTFATCASSPDTHDRPSPAGERELRFVAQESTTDCGDAALTMTFTYYGRGTTLAAVAHAMPPNEAGVNALQIVKLAEARGLGAHGVQIDGPNAAKDYLERGDILHVDGDHWVVVDGIDNDGVHVLDPARGARLIHTDPARHELDGIALLFSDSAIAMAARMRRYQR